MSDKHVIAIDLGAASGRVMEVRFDGANLHLEERYRFANVPVLAGGVLYWDALRLWQDITEGIRAVPAGAAAMGVDAWGVDFALLDRDGNLLCNPVHYRDERRNKAMMQWVFDRVPRRTVFERTGIQFMQLNGLYQLAAYAQDHSPLLDAAATFVTIADLFNFWLTGARSCEFTQSTTQQCFNPRTYTWDVETLQAIGVPTGMFPEVVPPGARLGEYAGIPVIAPAAHDTGSAVVAVPTTTANYAYLSSGTWSLLGLEVAEPIINDASYEANVTNEGGAEGTFRLLKNITGLWFAQQCRAEWQQQGREYSYGDLSLLAQEAEPFRSFIDPDDVRFIPPGDMLGRIRRFCGEGGQPVPETPGQVMRTIYESLALKYRYVLDKLLALSGRTVDRLHIIGGGSQDNLLCQMTADAIGREVVAGPVEATALGNAIVQLITLGELGSVAQARELLSRSAEMKPYTPRHVTAWETEYQRFKTYLTTN